MGYRLINHLGCWQNTRRICKPLACGSWFTNSSCVISQLLLKVQLVDGLPWLLPVGQVRRESYLSWTSRQFFSER